MRRHIAYALEEGGLWLSGKHGAAAALAPIRMPWLGVIRDRIVLGLGYGLLYPPRMRRPWYRRHVARLMSSHAYRMRIDARR